MISPICKGATSLFRSETRVAGFFIQVATLRAAPYRTFSSNTANSATMASVQQTAVRKRAVGKKFVIACDGEFRVDSWPQNDCTDKLQELGW